MSLTREQLAGRVRETRESLRFTQADVAEALDVHRPTVSEIEAGRRALTSEELYRLTRFFAISIADFLAVDPPEVADVERVLFRRRGLQSGEARTVVKRLIERCRAEKELEDLLEIEPAADHRPGYHIRLPESVGDAIRQGEWLALQERRRLQLGAEPIRNPLALLAKQGVRIGTIDITDGENVDGVYFETDELGACIGVSPPDEWTGFRSVFTAAHEYAHWLLGDVQVEEYRFAESSDDLKETRANCFAAAFLMPKPGLTQYFKTGGLLEGSHIPHLSRADIVRAMDHFGVSRIALLYRLQNTELMAAEKAEELRALEFRVTETADALGLDLRAERNERSRLETLAIEAWRKGLIGAGRAADLLDLDVESFRDRMREFGEEQEVDAIEDTLIGAR